MRSWRGLAMAAALALPFGAGAQELTGRDIMQKVRDQTRSEDSTSEMLMRIQAKRGERVREIRMYSKSYGDVDKALMRFLSPPDVKGTGFLVWGHEDEPDEQWLYLPALRRVRKIATSRRGGSFMGSDFTYYDFEDRSVDESEHRLLRSEPCGEHECHVVESVDKNEEDSPYSKARIWVQGDRFVPVKMELYDDKKGEHIKTATFEDYEKIEGIWVARKVTMENLKKGTRTVLELQEVQLNRGLDDELFTQRYLTRER